MFRSWYGQSVMWCAIGMAGNDNRSKCWFGSDKVGVAQATPAIRRSPPMSVRVRCNRGGAQMKQRSANGQIKVEVEGNKECLAFGLSRRREQCFAIGISNPTRSVVVEKRRLRERITETFLQLLTQFFRASVRQPQSYFPVGPKVATEELMSGAFYSTAPRTYSVGKYDTYCVSINIYRRPPGV